MRRLPTQAYWKSYWVRSKLLLPKRQAELFERNEETNALQPGDQIEIVFPNTPGQSVSATVSHLWSDQQEGLSPEAEDYVLWWLEISSEHQGTLAHTQTIAFRADWKYYMDGGEVEIRTY